jgi:transposase InsO family protein
VVYTITISDKRLEIGAARSPSKLARMNFQERQPLFGAQSPKSIASYFKFYNQTRPHQSLDGKIPDEVYFGNPTLLLAA